MADDSPPMKALRVFHRGARRRQHAARYHALLAQGVDQCQGPSLSGGDQCWVGGSFFFWSSIKALSTRSIRSVLTLALELARLDDLQETSRASHIGAR